ncbi:MAG: ferrochelatase [Bacteroidia bacterium]|jgi:ferrochelatase
MSKKAILLTNLGSPDSTSVKDVRTYLNEFLMDGRVIDIPYLARLLLVRGIIVPFRAKSSAEKYKSIWTKNGSPLIQISKELTLAVQAETGLPAYLCMRYANPTPASMLKKIKAEHPDLEELVLLPLYPHFAMSSYETGVLHVQEAHRKGAYPFQLKVVQPFYNHPDYIAALAESIQPYLTDTYDQLLFSYHGIPERHIHKSDPTGNHCLNGLDCCSVPSPAHSTCYRHQVFQTTEAVAKRLNLPKEKYSISFQSRLGRDKWLSPSTAQTLQEMPARGIKKTLVVCPAFVSDCLETLEEMNMEGRETFMQAGGEMYVNIPCLNTNPAWVKAVNTLIQQA